MHIGILKETAPGERRVSAVPDTIKRLIKVGHTVSVQTDAGGLAGFADNLYAEAGAAIVSRAEALSAGVVSGVNIDSSVELPPGSTVVGLIDPLGQPTYVAELAKNNITAISFETVPRTTLAQSMDVLSSQANIGGYRAVLEGASRLQRFMPMLTTAAGTVKPARLLVLGVGVAGLQAIATGRRLGAIVSAFDVREVVAEQVESLGATFVKVDLEDQADDGGYAKSLADDEQTKLIRGLDHSASEADVIVCTAQIPGRAAPILLDDKSLAAMKEGAVVVDLASGTGGNTTQTPEFGDVVVGGVTIVAGGQLVSAVASDASTLFGRNLAALVAHLFQDGDSLDLDEEIADGAVVTSGGQVRHPRVQSLLEGS